MIFRCKDQKDIAKILNHPKVFKWISDDFSPTGYIPVVTNEDIIYLMNKEKTGVIKIGSVNFITCHVHIATMPELWGKVDKFVREAICWGFERTQYMKIIAFIPVFNRLAIRLAKKSGFQKEGCIKKSFLKNWKLHDQAIFGLSKEDFLKELLLCQVP